MLAPVSVPYHDLTSYQLVITISSVGPQEAHIVKGFTLISPLGLSQGSKMPVVELTRNSVKTAFDGRHNFQGQFDPRPLAG